MPTTRPLSDTMHDNTHESATPFTSARTARSSKMVVLAGMPIAACDCVTISRLSLPAGGLQRHIEAATVHCISDVQGDGGSPVCRQVHPLTHPCVS